VLPQPLTQQQPGEPGTVICKQQRIQDKETSVQEEVDVLGEGRNGVTWWSLNLMGCYNVCVVRSLFAASIWIVFRGVFEIFSVGPSFNFFYSFSDGVVPLFCCLYIYYLSATAGMHSSVIISNCKLRGPRHRPQE
jgi:hypothetical protein